MVRIIQFARKKGSKDKQKRRSGAKIAAGAVVGAASLYTGMKLGQKLSNRHIPKISNPFPEPNISMFEMRLKRKAKRPKGLLAAASNSPRLPGVPKRPALPAGSPQRLALPGGKPALLALPPGRGPTGKPLNLKRPTGKPLNLKKTPKPSYIVEPSGQMGLDLGVPSTPVKKVPAAKLPKKAPSGGRQGNLFSYSKKSKKYMNRKSF